MSTSALDRRFKKRWLAAFGIVLTLALAQTPWGLSLILRGGLHVATVDLAFHSLQGFWLRSVEIHGIEGSIGAHQVKLETARVRLSKGHLFKGRLHMNQVELIAPEVYLENSPSEETAEEEKGRARRLVWIDSLQVQQGRLHLQEHGVEVSGIQMQASMTPVGVQLEHLFADLSWHEEEFQVVAEGDLKPDQGLLRLDTLALSGAESVIRARGDLGERIHLDVMASPLSGALLDALLPHIEEELTLAARLTGTQDSVHLALNGESSAGGSLKLHGSTRIGTPSVQVDTLVFDQLNAAYFFSNLRGDLTGSAQASLHGNAWDALSGQVEVTLEAGSLLDTPIKEAQMTGNLEAGLMRVNLHSELALGALDLAGTVRPYPPGSGKVAGTFEHLNAQVIAPSYSSDLSGTFQMAWDDWMEAVVLLGPGRLGQLPVIGAELRMQAQGQELTLEANVHADSTRITLQAYRREAGLIANLHVDGLDAGAIMNQEPGHSRISLTADSRTNWPPDSLSVRVDVQPSFWEKIPIRFGYAELALQGLDLDFRGYMQLPSGNASIWGEMDFGTPSPTWTLTQGQLEGIDLRNLGIDIQTDLSAILQLSGTGFERAAGQLMMEPSKVNHESIPGGVVSLAMAQQELKLKSRFILGSGGLEAQATARPFADSLSIRVDQAEFQQINLGALLGINTVATRLSGRIGHLQWGNGGDAVVMLTPSTVNALAIPEAELRLQMYEDTLAVTGFVELDQGYMRLDRLQLSSRSSVLAQGSVKNLSLEDLGLADMQLSGSFDVDLTGIDPRTMQIHHAQIVADQSHVGEVMMDRFRLKGTMAGGAISVNEFEVHSPAGELAAEGGVSLFEASPDSLRVYGAIHHPEAFMLWTGGAPITGTSTNTFFGTLAYEEDSLRWNAGLTTGPLAWKNMRLLRASAVAQGSLQNLRPSIDQADLEIDRFSVPTLSARRTEVGLIKQGRAVQLEAKVDLDDRRSLHAEGTADFEARRGLLQRLDLKMNRQNWNLGVPTEILADEGIRIRYFVLESQDQEITLDGILDANAEQRLGVNLYNVELAPFTDLLGFTDLGGIANADLFFHGPATAPELIGSVDLIVDSGSDRVGSVAARIDYKNGGLDMEADLLHVDGSRLELSGLLPLDLRLHKEGALSAPEASLTLNADEFNLAWVSPFLTHDELGQIGGRLRAEIDLTGSRSSPVLTGELHLTDGYARLPQLGITPSDFTLDARMQKDTVYVDRIAVSSGRGGLKGQGLITLGGSDPADLDLSFDLEHFRVVNTAPYMADISGTVELGGIARSPDLTGHVEIMNAVIRPQDVPVMLTDGAIPFTEVDLQMLEQYFNIRASMWDTTTYSLVDALKMDLSVGIPGTARLHSLQNPEMNVLLSGSLALYKESNADQRLQGTVRIVPELSYVRQFGRRFDIQNGRVTFAGAVMTPFFDLQAALEIPNQSGQQTPITILLDASGRFQDLESLQLELRSEPVQLDRADMISYMATGRPAADAFQIAGGGALQSGSDLALQQLSSLVAGAAGASLGLDLVQINPETAGGVTLTAGKYVSRKLFASVKWPITDKPTSPNINVKNERELVIEYALYPWLVARMRGETGAMGLSLLYQYTW